MTNQSGTKPINNAISIYPNILTVITKYGMFVKSPIYEKALMKLHPLSKMNDDVVSICNKLREFFLNGIAAIS